MPLLFEPLFTPGLAQLSYLIGDPAAGTAVLIDPRRDVDCYIDLAQAKGVRIAAVVETHIHADFASGACELAARLNVPVYGGPSNAYEFNVETLEHGRRLEFGNVSITAIHTPGHTEEHICLLLADSQQGPEPFGILTGDTLFNLDVGRPDLTGEENTRPLAAALYHSLFDHIVPLGDRMEVYPCHGAGSGCGKSIGDRHQSTIGNEMLFNPAMKERSQEEFVDWLLSDMPEPPRHYARLKKQNAKGMPVLRNIPFVNSLSPSDFQLKLAQSQIVDARSMLAFGGGHVAGALNIGFQNEFVTWAGWMLNDERPIILVVDKEDEVESIARQLFRIGLDNVAGFLRNGMVNWQNAGLALERLEQWTVFELNSHLNDADICVLDVRGTEELRAGKVPGAKNIFVGELASRLDELDKEMTIATYCGTGYRASIAASVLQRAGFKNVKNVPGSWKAWKASGLPIEK